MSVALNTRQSVNPVAAGLAKSGFKRVQVMPYQGLCMQNLNDQCHDKPGQFPHVFSVSGYRSLKGLIHTGNLRYTSKYLSAFPSIACPSQPPIAALYRAAGCQTCRYTVTVASISSCRKGISQVFIISVILGVKKFGIPMSTMTSNGISRCTAVFIGYGEGIDPAGLRQWS